jgi:hypothetical protein
MKNIFQPSANAAAQKMKTHIDPGILDVSPKNNNRTTLQKAITSRNDRAEVRKKSSSIDFTGKENLLNPHSKNKIIYIEVLNKLIYLKIERDEEENLTCGWLLCEAIRKIQEFYAGIKHHEEFDAESVVCLQTKERNFALDYWLSCFERSVSVLNDGTILIPFFTGRPNI